MDELNATRRAVLVGLAWVSATLALAAGPSPDGPRFRDVRVDVSKLHDNDEDDEAAWVAAVLPGDLKRAFAKYLAPGDRSAGILVARIDNVSLGGEGMHMGGMLGPDTIDSIEGAGVVLDARGREVANYPLFATVGADSWTNSPYQTDIHRRRAETLAASFAQWLPGKMGL